MNEKLQYAQMLEIPISTVNISYKSPKKKKFKRKTEKPEEAKELLINKINGDDAEKSSDSGAVSVIEEKIQENVSENKAPEISYSEATVKKVNKKTLNLFSKPIKFNIIAVEFVLIGLLLATIIITNAVLPTSGINTLFASVFGGGAGKSTEADTRVYTDFKATLPVKDTSCIVLQDGVMTFSGEGSVYSPCSGMVLSSVKDENGKFTLEIAHNDNFKTVITGLDYVYFNEGQNVVSTIPVGYTKGNNGTEMCFFGTGGDMITGYTLSDGSLIWAV